MRRVLTITLSVLSFVSFAQTGREEKVSLQSNPVLQAKYPQYKDQPAEKPHSLPYRKAPFFDESFPFVDWFDQDTTELNHAFWPIHLVKIEQGAAVLNAQDSTGATYSPGDGSVGTTDILLSRGINVTATNGQLFISFAYSTGSTWKPTDVLDLEFKNSSGVFANVWSGGSIAAVNQQVMFPIDLSLFMSDSFAFRFVCKTERISTNNSVFLMHYVNVSDKPALPWYESFSVSDVNNVNNVKHGSPVNWQRAQPNLLNEGLIANVQSSVFDAYTRHGKLYTNNGYGDTLLSQPMDMTTFNTSDSVYFRFHYRKYAAADATDTLMLDFLDSAGQWVRIWKTSGDQASLGYTIFLRQMNFPAFRHANFQVRMINRSNYSVTDTMQFGVTGFHIGPKIKLPFVDDFSTSEFYPSSLLWKEKKVFVNNDFAIAPPSINVATFDGLDERGNAYGQGDGYLDSLTSWPINLNGLTRADSVYLSFYVQPQGLGDIPEPEDSLILEFRTSPFFPGAWQTAWSGTAGGYSLTAFTKIVVHIDSMYLNDDFQFRFKNIGGRSGNLDNWHVDYVILDAGRTMNEGYFDYSLSSNPPSLLKKYSSMPWKQYSVNPSAYTNSIQQIFVSNNDLPVVPMNYARTIYNPEGMLLDSVFNTNPGVAGESRSNVAINSSLLGSLTTGATATDSIIFTSKYYANSNNNLDNIQQNDTLSIQTILSNYFAYDDGTAEAGYGIANQPGSVALGYTLEVADSLYGISMFFNQSKADVSTQSFNIMVWSKIGTNGDGTGENVIKKVYQSRPTYENHRNGFYYMKFDQPVAMPKGKFYIGWEQSNIFNLNMGLDMNYMVGGTTVKNPDMWFKMYGLWGKTDVAGALMMRPIVGKWIDAPVGMPEQKIPLEMDAVVYPNPATDHITIRTHSEHDLSIELFDISGKLMLSGNQKSIPLHGLTNGMYLIKITDQDTGSSVVKKLLINQ